MLEEEEFTDRLDGLDLIENLFESFELAEKIKERYENNEANLEEIEKETQDILHFIELNEYSKREKLYIYEELRKCRQARREMRQENEILMSLYNTLDKYNFFKEKKFKNLKSELGNVRKDIEKTKDLQEKREYTPRIREDLDEGISIKDKLKVLKDKFD